MKLTSAETMKTNKEELADWERELTRLQLLLPSEGALNKIKVVEIPALEKKIKMCFDEVPALAEAAQVVKHHSIFSKPEVDPDL